MKDLPEKLRAVLVVWRDAHAVTESWSSLEDLDQEDALVFTAGWEVPKAKPGHVIVVQSLSPRSTSLDGVIAIPEENVYEVRYIGRAVFMEREAAKWA